MIFNDETFHYNFEDGAIVDFIPNFMTKEFSDKLFNSLLILKYEQPEIRMFNKMIKIPRLQAWMSDKDIQGATLYQSSNPIPWSNEVLLIKNKLEKITNFKFDYVLINYYRDGKDSISYHGDSEAIGENKNVICGVTVGAQRKFVMRHVEWKKRGIEKKEFLLSNGSLIIMKGDNTQKFWQHSVPKTSRVMFPRFNLTFRHS